MPHQKGIGSPSKRHSHTALLSCTFHPHHHTGHPKLVETLELVAVVVVAAEAAVVAVLVRAAVGVVLLLPPVSRSATTTRCPLYILFLADTAHPARRCQHTGLRYHTSLPCHRTACPSLLACLQHLALLEAARVVLVRAVVEAARVARVHLVSHSATTTRCPSCTPCLVDTEHQATNRRCIDRP